MQIIPHGTKINFLGATRYATVLSIVLIAYSIYIFVSKGDSKYGIDFTGGHELLVQATEKQNADIIRQALNSSGITDAIVQSFEIGSNEYSIRLGLDVGNPQETKVKVENALKEKISDPIQIVKTDFVGPTVGAELKRNATYALIFGLLGMLTYIAFRFEFSFALGAVAALFHDVILCFGVYLLSGFELSMGAVAAALTIIGYSVNDTIVIFDRVREEVLKAKGDYDLKEIMNDSINFMLDRTVVTHLLTLFSALALLLVGGGSIADLSLFLVIGIIAGSYSTIYISAPVAVAWENFRSRKAS